MKKKDIQSYNLDLNRLMPSNNNNNSNNSNSKNYHHNKGIMTILEIPHYNKFKPNNPYNNQ
jgi:hypothetical protein